MKKVTLTIRAGETNITQKVSLDFGLELIKNFKVGLGFNGPVFGDKYLTVGTDDKGNTVTVVLTGL